MNGLQLSWIVRNNNPIRDVILYNLRENLKAKAQLEDIFTSFSIPCERKQFPAALSVFPILKAFKRP